MSTGVGSQDFDVMRGNVPNMRLRVETWTVPGVDGYGIQTMGMGDADFDLTTIKYVSGGASLEENDDTANGVIATCIAMQGTIVQITTDWNDTFDIVAVLKVDVNDAKKPCIYNGDPNAIRLEVKWKMITNG